MKKSKSLIALSAALILLIGGLAAYTLWDRNQGTEPGETTGGSSREYLLDLEIDEVSSIELSNTDGTFVWNTVTEGEDSKKLVFELSSPEVKNLDSSAAANKAKDFLTISSDTVASENAEDLSVYGLDKPTAEAVITLEDGGTRTVTMGNTLRNETRLAYAAIDGSSKVYVVSGLNTMMDFRRTDLITKTIIPFKLYETESFRFLRARDGIDLSVEAREPELAPGVSPTPTPEAALTEEQLNQLAMTRNWQITAPFEWEADAADVNTLVAEFQGLKAAEILEPAIDDPAKYGLDKPDYQYTLFSQDGQDVTVMLGKEESSGRRYMSVEGREELMAVNMANFTMIDRPQVELVNAFVSLINIQDLESIWLHTPEGEYDIEVFHPSAAEKEEDETLVNRYTVNGEDATVTNSKGDFYFRKLYSGILSIMVDGEDLDAEPDGEAEYTVIISKRVGDDEATRIDLVARDSETYYIYKNETYTGFYTRRTRLDNETANPDNSGLLQLIDRLLTAMENAVDGEYDFPPAED